MSHPFSRTLRVSIDIAAPIEHVWQVLTDFSAYAAWNRFTPQVECSGVVGQPAVLTVHLRDDAPQPHIARLTLNAFDAPHCLCWGSFSPLLKAERCQTLTALDAHHTRYESAESFVGLLVPLVMWTQHDKVMRGYHQAAEGLKAQAQVTASTPHNAHP